MRPSIPADTRLVFPESLREPLIEALSDLFIPSWPDTAIPIEPFAHSIAQVVDALLRGKSRVGLRDFPPSLIDRLIENSHRASERITQGTRRSSDQDGYSYRLVVLGNRVGAVMLIDVTSSRPDDEPCIFASIATLFSPEEFDRERRAIQRIEYDPQGLTQALAKEMAPNTPVRDQSLDYNLEFDLPAPRPR